MSPLLFRTTLVSLLWITLLAQSYTGFSEPQEKEGKFHIAVSDLELIEFNGSTLSMIIPGQQVLIRSQISNIQGSEQNFSYIVQVKDSNEITVSLSWISAKLSPHETIEVAQSWIPAVAGNYTIEIFVWQNVLNPVILSDSLKRTVRVFPLETMTESPSFLIVRITDKEPKIFVELQQDDLDKLPLLKQAISELEKNLQVVYQTTEKELTSISKYLQMKSQAKYGESTGGKYFLYNGKFYETEYVAA